MDRPISTTSRNKERIITLSKYVFGAVILFSLVFFTRQWLTKKGERKDFHIAVVEKGEIQNTLTASGVVVPSYEREINSPVSTEIKTVLKNNGAAVKKGDVIILLDQEYTQLQYDQLYDELQLKRNNVDKLKLEFDKNLKDLDYQDKVKELELSRLSSQVVDQKRLKDVGGSTAEEVEQAELSLKVAELEKKILENDLDYRKSVNVIEKKGLELEYKIQEKKLLELKRKLRETEVRAPQDGVITWINEDIGKKVNEGEALVRIANLNSFKVEATSSDRNTQKINVGMPVQVRINQRDLAGAISAVLPAVENNTVKFIVDLEDAQSEILRPNMRAEVYIITDKSENVLRIKNGSAFNGATQQEVFVVEGDHAVKRMIKKGLSNSDYVEILENAKLGEQIIISDTKDYDHLDQFIIVKE